jgi:hypothetical protein
MRTDEFSKEKHDRDRAQTAKTALGRFKQFPIKRLGKRMD